MKRLFPRVVSAVAGGCFGLLVFGAGAGCDPNNNVKPGAPVLVTFLIYEPSGAITYANGTQCPADVGDGMDCDPNVVTMCQIPGAAGAAPSYCQCNKKSPDDMSIMLGMPKTTGSAACPSSFDPASTIVASFDRLIDPAPFDVSVPDGDADAAVPVPTDIANVNPMTDLSFDYSPNGIFHGFAFQPNGYGTPPGPHITITSTAGFAQGAVVTITLSKTKILAKDGKTPFTGTGLIQDGVLTFMTNPPPTPPDGGTD
jgi:hypothetical protein